MSQGLGIYIYIIHYYCLVVESGFYSDVVECLSVYPATWVRFQLVQVKYLRSSTVVFEKVAKGAANYRWRFIH